MSDRETRTRQRQRASVPSCASLSRLGMHWHAAKIQSTKKRTLTKRKSIPRRNANTLYQHMRMQGQRHRTRPHLIQIGRVIVSRQCSAEFFLLLETEKTISTNECLLCAHLSVVLVFHCRHHLRHNTPTKCLFQIAKACTMAGKSKACCAPRQ